MFMGLTRSDVEKLEYEVISERARLKLTRLIRDRVRTEEDNITIIYQNQIINIANNVLGLELYILKSDGWGDYHPAEHAWHYGEIEMVMRRPKTAELIEILADILEEDILDIEDVNEVLKDDGCSVHFEVNGRDNNIRVSIVSVDDIEEVQDTHEHPNIRKLISRMGIALENKDFPAVLHASASVFEALAKDIVSLQSVQNKSLGSFFERYKKESSLPEPILNYILNIFNRRNTEPLAGHGSLQQPKISRDEALILSEMTKTFVRIERQLALTVLDKLEH